MRHIVCYSGGHSSAVTAIEVVRRFGPSNVTLLNHDIKGTSEGADIKRFKSEVSRYLGVPVTPCNMPGWETKDQFDVVVEAGAFKVGNGTALCTNRLKTRPFEAWLSENAPKDSVIYYGFDQTELRRVQRRSSHLALMGYRSDYPLALWPSRTISSTEEIGIRRPASYDRFKHANCIGCLKAGKQHWYVVFCTRPDIWARGVWAEDEIGYTILRGTTLTDLEPLFARMRCAGILPTEHTHAAKFLADVKRILKETITDINEKPCECVF
jgi:hypothetical protein